ncbi:hypothetical protein [Lutispora sp.]|uniref:hypothetical protein n=1 Tax=Lutispora sp. TaxID=2828727 RepID=UPI002B204E6A|nr:hypothetical protein [Lutispora sp.]MEA4963735.1 hypothetical protein [Lutispora sp.]
MEKKRYMIESRSFERFYGDIDTSRFRSELDLDKAKQLIFWSVGGYADQILNRFKSSNAPEFDFEKIRAEFDGYLNELRKTYYE